MQKIFVKLVSFLIIVGMIAPAGGTGQAAPYGSRNEQLSSAPVVCFVEPPSIASFPQVSFTFRMFNAAFEPVLLLSPQEAKVSENTGAPIPLSPQSSTNNNGVGLDLFVVTDIGNRTTKDLKMINVIKRYAPSITATNNKDRIWIYTDRQNGAEKFFSPESGLSLSQALANFTDEGQSFNIVNNALSAALDTIESQPKDCARPRILFLVIGDETLDNQNLDAMASRIRNNNAKLVLIHVPYAGEHKFQSLYRDFATKSKGDYHQVKDEDAIFSILESLQKYRATQTVSYVSTSGISGTRQLRFIYQDTETHGNNSFNVSILPATVNMGNMPGNIQRVATTFFKNESNENVYAYDISEMQGEVSISWPDGYPRSINGQANLVLVESDGSTYQKTVALSEIGADRYQFTLNIDEFQDKDKYTFIEVYLVVNDSLGVTATSNKPGLTISNTVPVDLFWQSMGFLVWIFGGFGAVVLLMLMALVLMWLRFGSMASVANEIKRSGLGEAVRKTIVGGGKRKQIAGLKILDGPVTMLGQEIKIYTEMIRLGRDPQKADITFFTPDANSSVSGLHCKIERVNNSWRIIAESKSGSETVVDGESIPFFEPYPISTGQKIRLGSFGQQPVIFEFSGSALAQQPNNAKETDIRRTDVAEADVTIKKLDDIKREPSEGTPDDTAFDKFRNRK